MNIKSKILNLIFPSKCIVCGEIIENDQIAICKECIKKIEFNKRKCRICGKPLDTVYGEMICFRCKRVRRPFAMAFVPFIYKGNVRTAIKRYKFYHKISFYKTFAYFIFEEIQKSGYVPDIVTYVPVHFTRLGERGFNQSKLVARELASLLGARLVPTLKKVKRTKPLYGMAARERENTVRGSFACKKEIGDCRRILIVDDIITTGATLSECTKILKNLTNAEISIAVIAAAE
ncbi:MAG: ComF family protein [Clostridia bacterium]|nr:ComF family protein [Clostridia bacterium]